MNNGVPFTRGITAYKNVDVGIRVHGSYNIRLEDVLVSDSLVNIDMQNHSNGTVRCAFKWLARNNCLV
jgi:hypothetical protein